MRGVREEFDVDTDRLESAITQMRSCESALALLTRDVDAAMTVLRGFWQGEAAQAQELAQAEWQRGLGQMRATLTSYRTNARSAHGNYVEAAETNARMWVGTS
jgi:WXG100 family type VII secretion target